MHPAISATPDTEEHAPGLYGPIKTPAAIYAPFLWLALMMIRLGLRAGFISPEFLMPSRPQITPQVMHRNRQLRRARASCLKRARRHAVGGRKIKPENYQPKAYAHYSYIDRMDKSITPAQFREHYIRDNDVSRVQVYRLDSAHEITAFTAATRAAGLAGLFSILEAVIGNVSLGLGARADPAPP